MNEDDRAVALGAFVVGATQAALLIAEGYPIPTSMDETRAFLGQVQSAALGSDPRMRGVLDGDLDALDPRRRG